MNQSFQYEPLIKERRQIRLVQLTSKGTSEIACNIYHYDLNEHTPKYQALSYTWGPELPEYQLNINRNTFVIRENLYEFLKSFQAEVPLQQRVYLWVDQICINQHNKTEKSWQVQMMSDVYKRASEVLVWLGAANQHTECATWLLQLLQDDWALVHEMEPIFHGHFLSGSMLQAYKDLVRRAQRKKTLSRFDSLEEAVVLRGQVKAAIGDFLDNRYWTRLWIVQEIMLARTLVVWWGAHRISREALKGLTQKISVTYEDPSCASWLKLGTILDFGMSRDYELGYDEPADADLELSALVRHFCSSKCENELDKVFGFIAIARNGSAVQVDYSRATEEVYLDGVRAMALGILSDAERSRVAPESMNWESFISECYVLGAEMIPEKFKSLPSNLRYNATDAGKLIGFDQARFLNDMAGADRGNFMMEQLKTFLARQQP